MSTIRVANAPCSYGAFEITIGVVPNVPAPGAVLAAIAAAGYEGTELGPPGYLGSISTLGAELDRAGLELAGGFIPVRFSETEHWDEDLRALEATLELFRAAGGTTARAVLADAGSRARIENPGRAAHDRSIGLDSAGWERLAQGVARAAEVVRRRGFEPTFHHHAGTCVEAPWEVERLLELTDVGLLLDTGHLLLGGGDPVRAFRDWRDRINHLHVKDVRLAVLRDAVAAGADMSECWRGGVFCELGTGDVDLEGFFAELATLDFDGWIVVEQDWVPRPGDDIGIPAAAQVRNRSWLERHAGY
ncbi:MAG: sugar phosphate isomerase/epimerase [Gaiellaceae bacterium MAG52_C11]|nr:sugar phosphate isomerase/epimerase [Candidatus Gaiellasilicea maunaloa]